MCSSCCCCAGKLSKQTHVLYLTLQHAAKYAHPILLDFASFTASCGQDVYSDCACLQRLELLLCSAGRTPASTNPLPWGSSMRTLCMHAGLTYCSPRMQHSNSLLCHGSSTVPSLHSYATSFVITLTAAPLSASSCESSICVSVGSLPLQSCAGSLP